MLYGHLLDLNTSNNWYNSTGLNESTAYTIAINTVDTVGNMNATSVVLVGETRSFAPSIIMVDGSGGADYLSIQAAIDNASAGDTIEVRSGTYYENVNISIQLILQGVDTGAGKPVVDANTSGNAIGL